MEARRRLAGGEAFKGTGLWRWQGGGGEGCHAFHPGPPLRGELARDANARISNGVLEPPRL